MKTDEGNSTDVFLAGLLADVGLLDLPPEGLSLWKQGRLANLKADEITIYQNHPISSLHKLQSRNIPLTLDLQQIVQNTHEQNDMKGFPKTPIPDRIPMESMMIHFAELVDREIKVNFGRIRQDSGEVRRAILDREKEALKAFPQEFLTKIAKVLEL